MKLHVAFILSLLLAVPAAAQVEEAREALYVFDVDSDQTSVALEAGGEHRFEITLYDDSRDSTSTVGGLPGGIGLEPHPTSWSVTFRDGDNRAGWNILMPSPARTFGGETVTRYLTVQASPTLLEDPTVSFTLNATHKTPAGRIYNEIDFSVFSPGPDTFNALPSGSLQLAPREIGDGRISINSNSLVPREFIFEIRDNPCGLAVAAPASTIVPAKGNGKAEVTVAVRGPEEKFRYNYEICSVKLDIYPAGSSNLAKQVTVGVTITGIQVNPVWLFNTAALLLAAFVIFLIVKRRKDRIEEEILGRPQKPWLIPVEQVYLEHLKERDPRAHYVVRHYLMEEEYQSALMWYKDYKGATKGTRSKERLVITQEHKYQRFRKKWKKRIAKPEKQAIRLEQKLQKKLDRQGKSGLRKQKRKWRKLTRKMKAAHKKKVAKVNEKWEKQKLKAAKKAQPEPPEPAVPEPNYPAEPSGDRLLLKDHKWQKKVIKAKSKAVKKTGNLEVKFEKQDAKMLAKVRRKVLKIARKLDDPEFESEHPLLGQDPKVS